MAEPVISVRNLRKWYRVRGGVPALRRPSFLKAVDDISFDVEEGRTLGLVGESGCGKSTTLRVLLQLEAPTAGTVWFEGEDVATLSKAGRKRFKQSMQAVFQDPWASLNPRMRVSAIVAEPLQIAGTLTRRQVASRVAETLTEVGLNPHQANLYPHELSGGQRQRVGIARALAQKPRVVALDEPVSALDVSIRAQIMNLLVDLQQAHDLAYVLVAHNLATVHYMCHRLAVMYLGLFQEVGEARAVLGNPLHLYTKALLSAALPAHPDAQPEEIVLPGEVVSPIDPPPGDLFMGRTPLPVDRNHRWARERPPLVEKEPGHWVVDTPWSCA